MVNELTCRCKGAGMARRLARALVSDIVAYYPQKREEGARNGTLKQLFREEIKKSYEEYVDQVGKEFAESTPHFQDALNEVLAAGRLLAFQHAPTTEAAQLAPAWRVPMRSPSVKAVRISVSFIAGEAAALALLLGETALAVLDRTALSPSDLRAVLGRLHEAGLGAVAIAEAADLVAADLVPGQVRHVDVEDGVGRQRIGDERGKEQFEGRAAAERALHRARVQRDVVVGRVL